ncbi:NADP-dependent oxidoreductase [Paenibacillus sp. P96]|uniref:NADP-dependent oxidoreductase n=1 Tax=Paenibacillus zeirhizosphaerae TaxID=2987519 RepID=A0ABT9FUC7_9BACL|nr:NADP-dependent oxidoreductase [Paenibacillus sp. P96]MDP4098311.1 NADP-dependent oxidoreductase [Paenibacillus sp. P96]
MHLSEEKMNAAALAEFGGPEVLRLIQVHVPEIGAHEILVRVKAAGVQPADCAVRSGWTPPGATITFPQIVGNEFSGIVVQLGENVSDFAMGDEVTGFRSLGCYAEYVAVPADQVVRKPHSMSWEVAGGLSGAGQTAHTAIEELQIQQGETVLINGAAGGVGTVAVQIARERGATVIATARKENHDYLRSLGAIPVSYDSDLTKQLQALAPNGIDASLDAAGGNGLMAAVELTRDIKRVGTIYAFKDYERLGIRWISSNRNNKRLDDLVHLYVQGKLKILVRKTFSLREAAEAHREVEKGHGRGKVILVMD